MTSDEPALRCAIYTRVSSDHQERDGTSLGTQEAACRSYAAEQGWQVLEEHVYRETHKRWLLHERPELTRLRAAARAQQFDVLLCYCVDRLSSQDAHVYILDEEFERAEVTLAFATEVFEDTAIGRFVRSAKVLAAAIEVEKIRERSVRGRYARVTERQQLLPAGRPLYGYRWPNELDRKGRQVKGRLEINPETAPVVQRMFQHIASGGTLGSLTRMLTGEGVPTPTGKSAIWSEASIATMLHKPAYKGEAYAWGWCKARKGARANFDESKAIQLPAGTIPALVDESTWQVVQDVLTRNKQRSIRNAKEPEAALLRGGFVKCGHCGRIMSPRPRSNGSYDYICRTGNHRLGECARPSIVTHVLDEAAWQKVAQILSNPEVIAREVERLRGTDPVADQLTPVIDALAQIERRQQSTATAISMIDDTQAAAPLIEQLKHLSAQQQALQQTRDDLLRQQRAWQEQQDSLDLLSQWSGPVVDNLAAFTYQKKRVTMEALGLSVILYRVGHQPRFEIRVAIQPETLSPTI